MSLKPCVACNKNYDAKLLHDGVCEKCLAAVVIKKWLRSDGQPFKPSQRTPAALPQMPVTFEHCRGAWA